MGPLYVYGIVPHVLSGNIHNLDLELDLLNTVVSTDLKFFVTHFQINHTNCLDRH